MSKKLYSDLVSTGSASLVTQMIAIISGILFPRLLGAEQWGLWSITSGLIGLLAPFAQLAMSTALVTYISKYKNDEGKVSRFVNSAYLMVILFSLVISISVIFLSNYLAESVFDDPRLTIFLFLGALILFFREINIMNRDYFRGFKNFKIFNILRVVERVSFLLIPLFLFAIFSFLAIYVAISQLIILSILSTSVLVYINKKDDFFKIFNKPGKKESITLLKFGIPLVFAATFIIVMRSIDRLLIGYFLETSDVGIYSVAASIPLFIGGSFAIISTVLLPTFSERDSQGISSNKLLSELFSMLLFVSIPLIIFIIIFSEDILLIVYGTEYVVGSIVLAIVSFEILLYGGYVLFRTAIQAKEQTGRIAIGIGLSALVNIFLNIILIPDFGIAGAAFGTMFSFILLFLYLIYLVKINYDISFKKVNIKIIISLLFSLIVFGYVISSILNGVIALVSVILSFIIIWYIFVYLSSPLWYRELINYLKDILDLHL